VYGKRGEEKDEQLAALCKKHHGQFHKEYGVAGNMNTQWEEFKMRFESGHA
jgi:hypothetical protein